MIKFTRFSAQIAAAALIMATAGTNVYAAEPAVAASSTAAVTATATAQETTATAAEQPSKAGSTTAAQAETKSSKDAAQAETKSGQQKQSATAGAAEETETVKQYEAVPKDGLVRASNGTWYYYRNNQVDCCLLYTSPSPRDA